MKKSFITQFAMMMFMAFTLSFTLASCGEDAIINSDDDEKGATEFFTGNEKNIGEQTRTSIDKDRYFYWTVNDKLWVEQTPGNWIQSITNTITATQPSAKFYFNEPLPNETYNVRYTGLGNTSAESVTVRATQTQSAWDNGDHIATSGDCGMAEATHQGDRKYKFTLKHKAAYIILYPYMVSSIPSHYSLDRTYTLMKVEVKSADNAEIAGKFNFGADGITGAATDNASDMITLNCGTNGFPLENNANPSQNHLFIVLRPVELNRITFTYYVKDNTDGTVFAYDVSPGIRTYNPNGVTVLTHTIPDLVFNPTYYAWGSNQPWSPTTTPSTWLAPNEVTSGVWQYAPNANEMMWYIHGGIIVDVDHRFRIAGNSRIFKTGCWMKKKSVIAAQNSKTVAQLATAAPDGKDYRSVGVQQELYPLFYKTPSVSLGMPMSTVVADYFYLPGFGHYYQSEGMVLWSTSVYYWTRSAGYVALYSPRFYAGADGIEFGFHIRTTGFVVGQGWFQ